MGKTVAMPENWLMVSNNRGGYRKCYGGMNTKYNINDIMSQYYGYFKKKNKK